ncbi:hypothetical protein TNCT_549401 [Trichonephila clavata]|uniref:Uncharacterized protein n=1 Tax=Trichonephila clavata TaxID=2740835 RepID=A0A8X6FAI4_TRICU|nr:hypothetical protein TNCT_549401 [Trichonephila clavata]
MYIPEIPTHRTALLIVNDLLTRLSFKTRYAVQFPLVIHFNPGSDRLFGYSAQNGKKEWFCNIGVAETRKMLRNCLFADKFVSSFQSGIQNGS